MLALTLQTLLLMGLAYFAGAACACLIRRTLFARPPALPAERRVDPLPGVALRGSGAARFGRGSNVEAGPRPAAPPPPAASVTRAGADDLQQIKGIDAAMAARLHALGIQHFNQIAGWKNPEVRRIGEAVGDRGRISRENWIEQAQVLTTGGQTDYAKRRARGETASASPSGDEGEPTSDVPAPDKMSAATRPDVAQRAAFATPASNASAPRSVPEAAVSIRPISPPATDDLQRISGIDANVERRLAAEGVTRYAQIAGWSASDVERFGRLFEPAGRIAEQNWVEQAHILSRGGDTAYSRQKDGLPEAAPPPRPVRLGEAIRAQTSKTGEGHRDGQQPGARMAAAAAAGGPDDLKRIRGIGVLIEKKLKSMGIGSYEQIANWTAADIDRVSQSLDFKGRIERENWIEQARILASGGATEFSRRVDRGEVETSRYRAGEA